MTIAYLIRRILRLIVGFLGFIALPWMLLAAYVMGKPLVDEILGYRLWKEPMMSLARTVRDSGRCLYTGKRVQDDPDLRVHVIRSLLKRLKEMDAYESSVGHRLLGIDVSVDEFIAPEQRRVDTYEDGQTPLPPGKYYPDEHIVKFRSESDIEAISDEFLKRDFTIYQNSVYGTAMIPGKSIQKVPDAAVPDLNRRVRFSEWGIADTFLGYGRTMFELPGYGPIYHCRSVWLANDKPGGSEKGELRWGFESNSCEQTKKDIAEVRHQQEKAGWRTYIFVSNCGEVYGLKEGEDGGERAYRLTFIIKK